MKYVLIMMAISLVKDPDPGGADPGEIIPGTYAAAGMAPTMERCLDFGEDIRLALQDRAGGLARVITHCIPVPEQAAEAMREEWGWVDYE